MSTLDSDDKGLPEALVSIASGVLGGGLGSCTG